MNDKRKTVKNRAIILLLLFITIIAIGVTVWALFFRNTKPTLAPDYAPQQTEENAEPIEGDDNEKLEQPEGGGAFSLTYSTEVTVNLSEKSSKLVFANPGKSNQDMVLQIIIQDTVIVQSGLLQPGNQITSMNLLDGVDKQLEAGTYDGKFNVLFYAVDTGEKAVVNTEIPITVTVTE